MTRSPQGRNNLRIDFADVDLRPPGVDGRPCHGVQEWLERPLEPVDPLLGELFTTTSRVLFSADTGAGKSMLALAFAFAVNLGRDFLHWSAGRQARVLYLDGEMSSHEIQKRLQMACSWFRATPSDNLVMISREDYEDMPPLDSPDGQDWLETKIEELGPFDFIIFDNIMSLCVGIMKEEESWREVQKLVLSLTRRRIGQLWIHHTGHDKSRAYGTKTREWQMQTVIVGESYAADHLSLSLKFTKARGRGPENYTDFEAVHIELKDGRWSSSNPPAVSKGGRPNRGQEVALRALRKAIGGEDGAVSEAVWKEEAHKEGICSTKNEDSRNKAFQRARDGLIENGMVVKRNKLYDTTD